MDRLSFLYGNGNTISGVHGTQIWSICLQSDRLLLQEEENCSHEKLKVLPHLERTHTRASHALSAEVHFRGTDTLAREANPVKMFFFPISTPMETSSFLLQ